jgi:hypothetical protein
MIHSIFHIISKSITYQLLLCSFMHYPTPTFHIITGCMEYSGARVYNKPKLYVAAKQHKSGF